MSYVDLNIAMRQVTRWIIAARQDEHPAVQLLHANYAVGNLDMIRQLFTDQQVEQATGLKPLTLHTEATALQDLAQKRLKPYCPTLRIGTFLLPLLLNTTYLIIHYTKLLT
jgi:hypothetical protein